MGFFRYTEKDGPGVEKDAPQAPGYIRFFKVFFGNFAKMIGLNIMYVFACLPIITIGPATAALTYVMRNFSQGKHIDAFYDFRRKAKEYFKTGVIITLIDLVVGGLLYFAITQWMSGLFSSSQVLNTIALIVLFLVSYMFIFANFYLFPMLVSFDLPLKKLIRNSLILASGKLGKNILLLLFNGAVVFLCWLGGLIAVPFLVTVVFSLCSLYSNFIIFPVLVRYVMATPPTADVAPAENEAE